MDPEEVICSKCYRMRPIDEFHINKQGKRNATCKRHSKKRSLEIDDWENFIRVLRDWNKLDQTEILDGKYTFHLDALPVQFGRLRDDEDAFPRSELNAAMRDLNEIIWTDGAFRFTRRGTGGEGLTYRYHCSQDAMHVQKPKLRGKSDMRRDRTHMDRFPCESRLTMTPCLSSRALSLSIRHKWHAPYVDTQVPKVVEEMIIERASSKTPIGDIQ
ncbi:hypothetical protein N7535_002717 [Penicillium sp. DV-2018c]|nr:hypothetical protein N7535_002717 [Penicillium sp. DV-2018c]